MGGFTYFGTALPVRTTDSSDRIVANSMLLSTGTTIKRSPTTAGLSWKRNLLQAWCVDEHLRELRIRAELVDLEHQCTTTVDPMSRLMRASTSVRLYS